MPPVQLGRFQPMHPTLVAQPFHRPGRVYEEKYDGWRMLAYKDGRTVRLVSRRGRDHTSTFPDIALAVASLPAKTLVLDGEVCVFDCLYLRGRHLRDEPLLVRRRAVDATVGDRNMLLFAARRLAADGLAAWADVERRGLEGLVAKHEASSYRSGERSSLWRKVKRRLEGQFVIGGVTKDRGGWTMLLLGVPEDGSLRYVGAVRFGVTQRVVAQLLDSAETLVRVNSPFTNYYERESHGWNPGSWRK